MTSPKLTTALLPRWMLTDVAMDNGGRWWTALPESQVSNVQPHDARTARGSVSPATGGSISRACGAACCSAGSDAHRVSSASWSLTSHRTADRHQPPPRLVPGSTKIYPPTSRRRYPHDTPPLVSAGTLISFKVGSGSWGLSFSRLWSSPPRPW